VSVPACRFLALAQAGRRGGETLLTKIVIPECQLGHGVARITQSMKKSDVHPGIKSLCAQKNPLEFVHLIAARHYPEPAAALHSPQFRVQPLPSTE